MHRAAPPLFVRARECVCVFLPHPDAMQAFGFNLVLAGKGQRPANRTGILAGVEVRGYDKKRHARTERTKWSGCKIISFPCT